MLNSVEIKLSTKLGFVSCVYVLLFLEEMTCRSVGFLLLDWRKKACCHVKSSDLISAEESVIRESWGRNAVGAP